MRLTRLQLTDFRNIATADLAVGDAPVIALYGPNGAGKTNMLEAISLLSPGRGMGGARPELHTRHGAEGPGWGLHARVDAADGPHRIGMAWDGARRAIKIDGEPAEHQAALARIGNVVWFTPAMDRLFADTASGRRAFFDRLVFGLDYSHAGRLARLRHHLKARLKLLKQNAAADWLDVEEAAAAAEGVAVSQARSAYLAALAPYLEAVKLGLDSGSDKLLAAADPAATLAAQWLRHRERDRIYGSASVGPQRADISGVMQVDGAEVALASASMGQHKRAVLAILLANARLMQARVGQPPLLLMDEVTAHLDAGRRRAVLGELAALGTQMWLTGTERGLFRGIDDVQFVRAKGGGFERA